MSGVKRIAETEFDRRMVLKTLSVAAVTGALLTACSGSSESSATGSTGADSADGDATSSSVSGTALGLDAAAWSYDTGHDAYWQIGRTYVANPTAPDYQTLGIFVPGAYVTATDNGDGTYTAEVNENGAAGDYTASTAPIVFPVNTPGYSAQQAPSEYSYDTVASYLASGMVYVAAGMRGKDTNTDDYDGNAPWGVTDLKSAVRYVRYNAALIPGDKDRIFVFGHSGGGAQSTVMGSSGDSSLYRPYLASLGAALKDADGQSISDAVAGVMAWCPITNLDYANAAYEWNMGQFATTGTRADQTWTGRYSLDLAAAYAVHVNRLKLTDDRGRRLRLRRSRDGVYLRGSYHDHLLAVVQESLNNFLADTTFPYTPATTTMPGMGSGGSPSGEASSSEATTYQSVEEYIASLNADATWVEYDSVANTAKVLTLAGFVLSQKPPTKEVGAFDGIDRSATENVVLGRGEDALHFAPVSRDVIAKNESTYSSFDDWDDAYAAAQYTKDFASEDGLGKNVLHRSSMYNPMYYLSPSYRGYRTSQVAPHWRIRTGLMQSDTASTTEINLALALRNLGIDDVDFATVWGQGHTQAERTGDATTNFIEWVKGTA